MMVLGDRTSLIQRKVRKFLRLRRRILGRKLGAGDGRSWRLHQVLSTRLHKLQKRIQQLNAEVRLATVAGAVAICASASQAQIPVGPPPAPTSIGPFSIASRANNPLRPPVGIDSQWKPALVDLDKDGDLDLVMWSYQYDGYRYFKNEGTATDPQFTEIGTGSNFLDNPFYYVSAWSSAAFADLDKDGDLDLFAGVEYVNDPDTDVIHYFVNKNGKFYTETSPGVYEANEQVGPWNQAAKTGNPLHGIYPGDQGSPFFIDFDKDNDLDLFIGHSADANPAMSYLINDGNNQFTYASVLPVSPTPVAYPTDPEFADVDEDGDIDLITGDFDGAIRFYANNGSGNLIEQTGPWDPNTRTGSPFDGLQITEINPGYNATSLAFGDLDGDGHLEMIVGYTWTTYPYPEYIRPLVYKGKGKGVFELKEHLDNILDGVAETGTATVQFADINGDQIPDALVAGFYGNNFDLYFGSSNGKFTWANDAQNPFTLVNLGDAYFSGIAHQLVDFDKDNDIDLFLIDRYGYFRYFKNQAGVYTEQPHDASNPFTSVDSYYTSEKLIPTFVDIDADGDLDLFIGSKYGNVDYWKNENGTLVNQNPAVPRLYYTTPPQVVGPNPEKNPLSFINLPQPYYNNNFNNRPNIRFADLDGDGDLDLVFGTSRVQLDSDGLIVLEPTVNYYENTGTSQAPVFAQRLSPFPFNPALGQDAVVEFIDFDKDGDLDAFAGIFLDSYVENFPGHIQYYTNNNPAPVATMATTQQYFPGNAPKVLDPALTLADQDDDYLKQVTVSIQGFLAGKEELTFTAIAPVGGSYNATTGVLTLTGKGKSADYQAVLRTVAYRYTGPKPAGGRTETNAEVNKSANLSRTISISAVDQESTGAIARAITVQVGFPNFAPAVIPSGLKSTYSSSAVSVDNAIRVSDSDDADLTGAIIAFDPVGYIQDEDLLEFSNQNGISGTFSRPAGALVLTGTSSAANYEAALRSVMYNNNNFKPTSGSRNITFSVTDGETPSNTPSVGLDVQGDIEVYNGISPNEGDDLNSYFKIKNIETLEPSNKVSIFNRWGDKVYEVTNYDNQSRKFNGTSSSGAELPSGEYFYKIEFTSGRESLTGTLTIKR